jgi:transcriptional regulator with XRE-family HTH domain
MEFKDRLKVAREKAGLTQTQLAEAVGMTQATISELERGKSASTAFNARIAKECSVSAIWLETGEGAATLESAAATVRDRFAMAALQGMLAYPGCDLRGSHHNNNTPDGVAEMAYRYADAMLKARR